MAAFKAMPCNLDEIDRAIKRARGIAVEEPSAIEMKQHKKSPKPKRRGLSQYYDEW